MRGLVGIMSLVLAGLLVSLHCSAETVDAIEPPFSGKAKLIRRSDRGPDRVEIAAGSIKYVETSKNGGYQPEHGIRLTGTQLSRVYDYQPGISALQLFDSMESRLRRMGYTIVYRCQRGACGDLEGWKVFLGDTVSGEAASQNYLLARRGSPKTVSTFAQIFITDIKDRPRLILNTYKGAVSFPISIKVSEDGAAVEVPFDHNSAELTLGSREILRSLVDQLVQKGVSTVDAIEITGYTDARGTIEANRQLSLQRAQTIARWLGAEEALQGTRIVAHAGGISEPGSDNTGVDNSNPYRKAVIILRISGKPASEKGDGLGTSMQSS